MTTDPGAVPPDAKPLDYEDEVEQQQQQQQLLDPSASPDEVEKLLSTCTTTTTTSPSQQHLQQLQQQQRQLRLCRRCKAFKPQRAHHCSVCGRCIIKMDHHCPWINNCCAIGNHKYFLLFVFYTFLSCVYSLSLVMLRFATCMGGHQHYHYHHYSNNNIYQLRQQEAPAPLSPDGPQQQQHQHLHFHNSPSPQCLDQPSHLLYMLGLLIEALLFGMFTSCMMCDQASVVNTRMTHIDRLKQGSFFEWKSSGATAPTLSGLAEVFGIGGSSSSSSKKGGTTSSSGSNADPFSSFRLDWLSPWGKVCWDGFEQEIMGFCRPASSSSSSSTIEMRETTTTTTTSTRSVRSVQEIV
jgi:ribosomal protein L40E